MTEYQRQRKLLRDYLSRQRRQNINIKTKLPKLVKNPTEKSVERLKQARETAKQQAKIQREKKKKSKQPIPKVKTTVTTPESPVSTTPQSTTSTYDYNEDLYYDNSEDLYYDFLEAEDEAREKPDKYEIVETEEGEFIVDMETGEVVLMHADLASGDVYRNRVDRHYDIPNESIADHILRTYVYSNFVGNFSPNKAGLNAFFDRLVEQFGKESVAEAIKNASQDGVEITRAILYSDDDAMSYMDSILDYVEEAGEMTKAEYDELFGDFEQWNTEEDMELFEARYRG